MNRIHLLPVTALFLAFVFCGQPSAHAFVGALFLADRAIEISTKEALAIPEHGDWCAQKHPGYRKQWNNYKLEDGRVRYCASPYYTPPWMRWGQATQ